MVVSDWGATYDGEAAARAALDLTMPGPHAEWREPLVEAVRDGRVPEAVIDEKVRRILRLAVRVGALDGMDPEVSKPAAGRIEDAAPLAREAAAAAAVLLRNDGILPLQADRLHRVAVIGPGAKDARAIGGGSASVPLPYVVTPFTGLRSSLEGRAEVVTAVGATLSEALRGARADELSGPDGRSAVVLRWLDANGEPIAEQPAGTANIVRLLGDVPVGAVELEVVTGFVPDEDGDWRLGVVGLGTHALLIDGATVLEESEVPEVFDVHQVFALPPQYDVVRQLVAGRRVDVRMRFRWPAHAFIFRVGFVVGAPIRTPDEELAHAVELARSADVAVVVVGTSDLVESEGFDRTSLTLPGRQDELVRAVAAANPRTVVVVNSGAPVELPWRDDVSAVLVSWFPGMEFGNALADVLLGVVEPGGRLPTTWPTVMAGVPVLDVTPADGRLEYSEGLHIGHRAYLRDATEPAFWFGHGLGYTTWEWESIEAADPTCVTVRLRNTGGRAGKQVVQVYASRPDSAIERPMRWLAGFAVVTAQPGETVEVPVAISPRALRHWDGGWVVEPGELTLATGPSAGHLAASTTVAL